MALACFGLAFQSTAQTVISQNFSSGMAPWTVTTTGGGGGWAVTNVATSTQLGTIPAHGDYAVVNEGILGSSSYNNPTKMTSPTFSLTGVTTPYLTFDSYFWQAQLSASPYTQEHAWVNLSTDGGATYTTIDSIFYNGYPTGTFNTNWVTQFVSLGTATGANCMIQFCYEDDGAQIIGVAVGNIRVYDGSKTDLGLNSVTPALGATSDYQGVGTPVTFSGVVTNYNSTTSIPSYTVSYQVGTASVVNCTITSAVSPLASNTFSVATPFTPTQITNYPVKIWVTATGDANLSNDSAATDIIGVAFTPKKRTLFEECTGTWCGWCVRGIVYMDSLWYAHPNDCAVISVHNSDPMQSDNASSIAYDQFASSKISGFPSMIIDRAYVDDPSGCFDDMTAENQTFGFVNMGITATTTGGNVNAVVKVEPAVDMNGNYNLELMVEEDHVSGTGATWAQHDYYSYQSQNLALSLANPSPYNFQDSTNPIAAGSIKFPFVARTTLPASLESTPNGITGSLPSYMHYGGVYTYTFAPVAIASNWNAANLRVIAALIDANTTSATYGQVLNSITSASNAWAFINVGVANVNTAVDNVTVFPNPAANDAHVRFNLNEASTVQLTVFDAVGRKVFSTPSEKMDAGGQQINFSTEDFAEGIYNLVITTENGKATQRLSIVK